MTEQISGWETVSITALLAPLYDGKILHQGWSPRCENVSQQRDEWAVLKTTAIQDGWFDGSFNKRLPKDLAPKPGLEVSAGDILLTCAGPRVRCGVPCLVQNTRQRLMISGKMYRFRAKEDLVSPEYLVGYLRSGDGQKDIDQMKTGGNESGLNLTQERFFQLKVPLPSRDEQDRLIKMMSMSSSCTKAAREELDRVPKLIERYKQAVLAAAFRGELTAEWRTNHPQVDGSILREQLLAEKANWTKSRQIKAKKAEPTPFKIPEDFPPLPRSWTWMSVEELSTKVADGVHKKPTYTTAGVPFLTVQNLTAGDGISFAKCRFVSPEDHAEFIKRTYPEFGDILITKDGTLGVVRAVRTNRAFSIFVSVAIIKPVNRQMTDYLELALTSPILQGQMAGVGSGLQHIHLTDLRRDMIPIAPREERDEIVRCINKKFALIERAAGEHKKAASLVNRLEQAILRKAFKGELATG